MERPLSPTGRWGIVLVSCATIALLAAADTPAPRAAQMSSREIQRIVSEYFGAQPHYSPGDIISQSDVAGVLQELAAAGWRPDDHQQILKDALPDENALVSTLRSERGRRFMHKVNGFDLIYDRMDRLSQVSGGLRMLDAIVRLPDGEKYALPKKQTPLGVPDFLDLLPKNASGKVRSVKDYYKSTGRIYTETDLTKRLSRSLQGGVQTAAAK